MYYYFFIITIIMTVVVTTACVSKILYHILSNIITANQSQMLMNQTIKQIIHLYNASSGLISQKPITGIN